MSQSSIKLAEPSGNIANPEVTPVAKRRRFPKAYKLSILAEADQCHQRGQIGMLFEAPLPHGGPDKLDID